MPRLCWDMALWRARLLIVVLVICLSMVSIDGRIFGKGMPSYLHQAPEAHKAYQGWQAPGFCRSMWIMDRSLKDDTTSGPKNDRLFLKMQMDSSVKLIQRNRRKLFDWRSTSQMRKASKADQQNSSGNDKRLVPTDNLDSDGTWTFKDSGLNNPARFKLDMKDPVSGELYRYSCDIEFGKLDSYAVKFHEGTVYRFRGINKSNGLPINPEEIGSFLLRANVNRPIVGKDFQAIQH